MDHCGVLKQRAHSGALQSLRWHAAKGDKGNVDRHAMKWAKCLRVVHRFEAQRAQIEYVDRPWTSHGQLS